MNKILMALSLMLVSTAALACPDVSGNFAGQCTEISLRVANYHFKIEQNACTSLKIEVPMFEDKITVGTDFGNRVYGEDGAYYETRARYEEDSLITHIRSVSKIGAEILETTELRKVPLTNGGSELNFQQSLNGKLIVDCTIPEL